MPQISGYVTRYESSDGGSGDPAKTIWQVFVDKQAVTTTNANLAETFRLALQTDSPVTVTYDKTKTTAVTQVRIDFNYCDAKVRTPCGPKPGAGRK